MLPVYFPKKSTSFTYKLSSTTTAPPSVFLASNVADENISTFLNDTGPSLTILTLFLLETNKVSVVTLSKCILSCAPESTTIFFAVTPFNVAFPSAPGFINNVPVTSTLVSAALFPSK
ncbi:hypothetical protein SDC9_165289 [bioreactor metagenome]|uniref:Uncharacterized protein n=1 Tax=bioreactor metagenome TaxID=1076179 RepID=A0A645FW71_9ZZZZ